MQIKKDRKLNRWPGYNYSRPGYYFVTICTKNQVCHFGEVIDYEMKLNEIGEIVQKQILWLHSKILPLFNVIGAFKTTSSKLIHKIGHHDFTWQRSFHDRVIRNDNELSNKRDYIIGNPVKWAEDRNNSINIKKI